MIAPAELTAALAALKVPLPLCVGDDGNVRDATGAELLVVDPWRERREDHEANTIAAWIALCVNHCAGLPAALPGKEKADG